MKRQFFEMTKAGEMKKKHTPLNDEMTFNAMLNYLDSVKLSYGTTLGDVRFEEVTEKQRLIAKWLGCEGVFDTVPEYACVK